MCIFPFIFVSKCNIIVLLSGITKKQTSLKAFEEKKMHISDGLISLSSLLPGVHVLISPVILLFNCFISFMMQQPCSIIKRKFSFADKPEGGGNGDQQIN